MLKNKKIMLSIIIIVFFILGLLQGCISNGNEVIELRIFHAGSLSGPFEELEKIYERRYDDVDVLRESAGSADTIRKVTDLGKVGDVIGSADYTLIKSMMMENDPVYANWYIQFAVNRLVIAYTDYSTAKNEITAENWPTIFRRNDVNFGFSNPNADPCGYRSLMMLQLAEIYYDMPNLFEDLIQSHSAITVTQVGYNFTIKAPENLDPDSTIMIRPKEVDLIAQLETGELDYLIIYSSVAYQHRNSGVDFLSLPDIIDLSNPNLASDYDNVTLLQYSDKPGKGKVIPARPVVYGITIPTNAEHNDEAVKFIEMLLGEIGWEIFNNNGQPPIIPARVSDINKIPDELKNLVVQL